VRISALDHTLGHNPQRRELDFSVDTRLAICRRLTVWESTAGCPSADPTAREFFARARTGCHLWHGCLVASLAKRSTVPCGNVRGARNRRRLTSLSE
jgi:hypothetical protein